VVYVIWLKHAWIHTVQVSTHLKQVRAGRALERTLLAPLEPNSVQHVYRLLYELSCCMTLVDLARSRGRLQCCIQAPLMNVVVVCS
jgi:hypothetical protein